MCYRVVLTGPESTGKSTLAKQLAKHYQTNWVEEYARTYIQQIDRLYGEEDLLPIAQGQVAAEDKAITKKPAIVFFDTSLIVLKVWSDFKYQQCNPWIVEQLKNRHYDLFLLCDTDVPWAFDPQREHPNERQAIYQRYLSELNFYQKNFVSISGTEEVRLKKAIKLIDGLRK